MRLKNNVGIDFSLFLNSPVFELYKEGLARLLLRSGDETLVSSVVYNSSNPAFSLLKTMTQMAFSNHLNTIDPVRRLIHIVLFCQRDIFFYEIITLQPAEQIAFNSCCEEVFRRFFENLTSEDLGWASCNAFLYLQSVTQTIFSSALLPSLVKAFKILTEKISLCQNARRTSGLVENEDIEDWIKFFDVMVSILVLTEVPDSFLEQHPEMYDLLKTFFDAAQEKHIQADLIFDDISCDEQSVKKLLLLLKASHFSKGTAVLKISRFLSDHHITLPRREAIMLLGMLPIETLSLNMPFLLDGWAALSIEEKRAVAKEAITYRNKKGSLCAGDKDFLEKAWRLDQYSSAALNSLKTLKSWIVAGVSIAAAVGGGIFLYSLYNKPRD